MTIWYSGMCRAAIVLALGLGACSSPNPALYTIVPVDGTPRTGSPPVVLVREIGVSRYLERVQIVRSSESYRLDVMANSWWGEPPAAMLSRVLVQELQQRLPASSVYSESGAISSRPDATLELNVQRMDEDPSGQLVLIAQAGVVRADGSAPARRAFRIVITPSGSDVGAQVAATSQAVAQLADGLAAMLAGGA